MNSSINSNIKAEMKLAGICGVYCPSCTLYIGSKEDTDRLKYLSARMGVKAEDLICEGCRSDHHSAQCRNCSFTSCAREKKVDFCGSCEDFPCTELKLFQKKMPHRTELWESHKRIQEQGYELWFGESAQDNGCSQCGTINSAYDPACRSCGVTPASNFIRKHGQKIKDHLKR